MAFTLTKPLNTTVNENIVKPATLATSVGQLLQKSITTGAFESAGVATDQAQVLWKAYEATTGSDGVTTILAGQVREGDEYVVDTVNNSNSAHNGQRMIITAGGLTVTNTGTDAATGVFEQIAPVGAAADKKILARKV